MDYMREINAFERWLETNHLPCPAQLLWYRLMALSNRAGWPEWISVDNQRLMAFLQIERKATVIAHRDKLIEAGLLEFHRGKKGTPNRYRFISLIPVPKQVPKQEPKTAPQTGHITVPSVPPYTYTKTNTNTNTGNVPRAKGAEKGHGSNEKPERHHGTDVVRGADGVERTRSGHRIANPSTWGMGDA